MLLLMFWLEEDGLSLDKTPPDVGLTFSSTFVVVAVGGGWPMMAGSEPEIIGKVLPEASGIFATVAGGAMVVAPSETAGVAAGPDLTDVEAGPILMISYSHTHRKMEYVLSLQGRTVSFPHFKVRNPTYRSGFARCCRAGRGILWGTDRDRC